MPELLIHVDIIYVAYLTHIASLRVMHSYNEPKKVGHSYNI